MERFGKRIYAAHIVAWIDANGRLPAPSMFICHHCDNPPCVNPDHLYEGTPSQNALDSVARGRHACARKTHCKRGHEFTPENTYVRTDYPGGRRCRICARIADAAHKQRRRVG